MPTAGTGPTSPLLRITVPRRIEASPEEVFDAWAGPDLTHNGLPDDEMGRRHGSTSPASWPKRSRRCGDVCRIWGPPND
jgi:uncharacterized protein YndB with AHSA1/START domain